MTKRVKRFLDSVAFQPKDWLGGAESYVDNLSDEGAQWLLTKPYRADHSGTFFYEMYQVLNLLEALCLEQGAKVLEVGSGSGWVTELLAKLGYDVHCIEPSEKMIHISEERIRQIPGFYRLTQPTWFCTTLEEFDGKSSFYDAVIFHESLHHVIDEKAGLRNAYRVLKPGGALAVDEHAWIDGDHILQEKLISEMTVYGTLENPFSRTYLDELLADTGFRDITRFHMLNGFIEEELGSSSVSALAQSPCEATNNLMAVKPLDDHPCTRDSGCTIEVLLSLEEAIFDPRTGLLSLTLRIVNRGGAHLLRGTRGRPGEVYFCLYTGFRGKAEFAEAAYRNPLPLTLAPGAAETVRLEYSIPSGAEDREWYIDLVAEHRFWFSDKGVDGISVVPDGVRIY